MATEWAVLHLLRLQCQLDEHNKVNGIPHRPKPYQAIILSRRLAGSSKSNEPPGRSTAITVVRHRIAVER